MPDTRERWTLSNKAAVAFMVIFLLWTAVEIVRIVLGRAEELKNEFVTSAIGFGLVAWTYIYVVLHETHKRIFGIGEMLLGFRLMVPQIYELREKVGQHDISWRVTIIIGLVALMAKGMEDFIKSMDEEDERKKVDKKH